MDNYTRIHFIGIGGIGMSGLARLFVHEGKQVSGSDRAISPITCGLEALGIVVTEAQGAENITNDIDLVIYTEAMPQDHEELTAAREQGIRTINYFDALGMVANEYYLIAVAGTHGKTTTTAMLIDIFEAAGLDPTGIVGSLRNKTGSNFRPGKSKYCIVEACEYRRDFLSLTPDVLVVTNIEHEHADYYASLTDVQEAFKEFVAQVREGGMVVLNTKDAAVLPVVESVNHDVRVVNYAEFFNPLMELSMPGMHNRMNAAAALAVATEVGIDEAITHEALAAFAGTWRRFEYKGTTAKGSLVYDDYGHHPTEIRATLQGARDLYPDKDIILIFQPHTYTRTKELFDDFVAVLKEPDMVIVAPIYAAREENTSGVSSAQLAAATQKETVAALDSFDLIVKEVTAHDTGDTVIIVMGAGDIIEVAGRLTK